MIPRTITGPDRAVIGQLLATRTASLDATQSLADLVVGMGRATIVRPEAVPPTVVTLGSTVRVRRVGAGGERELTLVAGRAKPGGSEVSALSPVGAALVGRRVGDVAECDAPAGLVRFRIVAVVHQPERHSKPEPDSKPERASHPDPA